MRKVRIGNITIEYSLRETAKTKKLTINVTPGKVDVVVPPGTEDTVIEEFVYRRRRWIFTKVDEVEEAYAKLLKTQPSRFATGAKVPYRGRMMKLYVKESDDHELSVTYDNGFFVHTPKGNALADKEIKRAVEAWMKLQVQKDSKKFAKRYGDKLSLWPRSVRVKEQKHIWGSLGKDNIININWHLVFAPRQILEYVVAHEVCHLKYKNHSAAFWNLLRSVFRDADFCKSWLEKNAEVWEMGV